MTMRTPLPLFTSAAIMLACADPSPVTMRAREPHITDTSGVRTVLNYEPRWRPGEEWIVSAEPILRIGLVEGEREYLFDKIQGVTRLSDGKIVVLNAGDGQLRFYSPVGRHLRSIGQVGQGPGEVRGPRWLERGENDVLQVTHTGGRLRYGPDGRLLADDRLRWDRIHRISRRTNLPNSSGFLMEACSGVPAPLFLGDALLLCASTYGDVRYMPATEGLHETVSLVARSDLALEKLDTIIKFVRSHLAMLPAAGGRLESAYLMPPYGPRDFTRVTGYPARFIRSDAAKYRIEIHSIESPRQLLVVERLGGLRPPTDRELAGYDRTFEGICGSRQPAGDGGENRHLVDPADSLSVISSAPHIDARHAIWAPLGAPPDAQHCPVDVFQADGVYLGQVMFPRFGQIYEIGENYILTVQKDELGVEYVVVYGLDRRTTADRL